jgi:hypothetical protein
VNLRLDHDRAGGRDKHRRLQAVGQHERFFAEGEAELVIGLKRLGDVGTGGRCGLRSRVGDGEYDEGK